MTAEIVNLRRARKNKLRAERESDPAANRLAFGRTRAERETGARETAKAARHLDGHRLVSGHEIGGHSVGDQDVGDAG